VPHVEGGGEKVDVGRERGGGVKIIYSASAV